MKVTEITVNISKKLVKYGVMGSDMASASMMISIEDESEIAEAYAKGWSICYEEIDKQQDELETKAQIKEVANQPDPEWVKNPAPQGSAPPLPEHKCSQCGRTTEYKSGTSKVGKAYKGWFCSEKGHPVEWIK